MSVDWDDTGQPGWDWIVDSRRTYLWTRSPLQLGFDGPGNGGLAEFLQDDVVAFGIEVFGVDQQSVHVEQTCADFRESKYNPYQLSLHNILLRADTDRCVLGGTYSFVLAIILAMIPPRFLVY